MLGSRPGADRAPRLPRGVVRSAGLSKPGSHKSKIPSAFCEFSRPCKAENFRFGRNAESAHPRYRHTALTGNDWEPALPRSAHRRTRARGDAGLI